MIIAISHFIKQFQGLSFLLIALIASVLPAGGTCRPGGRESWLTAVLPEGQGSLLAELRGTGLID